MKIAVVLTVLVIYYLRKIVPIKYLIGSTILFWMYITGTGDQKKDLLNYLFQMIGGKSLPSQPLPQPINTNNQLYNILSVGGGVKPIKRSVSETKKKYVASVQEWKCAHCKTLLNHTFEIDHKIRLEHGGTNENDNLVALCRNCHGIKTANENM